MLPASTEAPTPRNARHERELAAASVDEHGLRAGDGSEIGRILLMLARTSSASQPKLHLVTSEPQRFDLTIRIRELSPPDASQADFATLRPSEAKRAQDVVHRGSGSSTSTGTRSSLLGQACPAPRFLRDRPPYVSPPQAPRTSGALRMVWRTESGLAYLQVSS
jgi:hypothetical protein